MMEAEDYLKAFLCLLCLRGFNQSYPQPSDSDAAHSVLLYDKKQRGFEMVEATPAPRPKYPLWVGSISHTVYGHLGRDNTKWKGRITKYALLSKPIA